MRYLSLAASITAMICVLSQNLLSDTVYLKNGRTFRGVITEKKEGVLVELPSGISVILNHQEIERIEKEEVLPEEPDQPEEEVSEPDEVGNPAKKSPSQRCREARQWLVAKRSGRAIRMLKGILHDIEPSEARVCCEILESLRDKDNKKLKSIRKR